ncbi:putative bifunctional diguanylate cyclase/phosphodiesterase [Vibrio vulnificus]|uniref:putative bifunctional diguanylate cyclase/phosphodiesterase n=1 Tax=Vibrio vulnificus TaxID=672 RepID=UPI001EEBF219|nr:bifunctional diguanylate cyclase/phosphodiesterase [Vibrio vulnificus]ELV8585341.1 bifunctional diguanylate cyclase/phosphodiesterase [Vibrio vulnificus]ELV8588908.1 bifunctional diguanylate cyclase/phosphodiesterase [Vibrio vulnificus]ELV8592625.1 bifunctional diguanylate cyclase/phosphodiesterase [Vibrio vulnificus]ELV8637394.1 bifunctional diguanylate cyclase/phosphodiesterase [Vibrio vulnificus]ELV8642960.1 bifunctional diguanylate cyclase/phosphodiesterase [Vibrio vulnificus]
MVDGRSKIVANSKVVLILKAAYIVAVLLITQTLVDEHTLFPWSYVLFAIAMIVALLSPSHKIKYVCALIATSYLFVGGIVDPLDIDVIEETFILLPLCYLLLFPGTIWAFVVALLLTASYFYTVPPEGLDELIEDAIELLVISAFASIMVYYQQKFYLQLTKYREDSRTDYLTQLPNRRAFYSDLNQVESLAQQGRNCALLKIDIDAFKEINESFGHEQADLLLKRFSRRLRKNTLGFGQVYRMEGDEFAVLVYEKHSINDEVDALLDKLKRALTAAFELERGSYQISYATGIALFNESMTNLDIWLRNSDIAAQKAKTRGRGQVRWYDEALLDETIRQHQIERELDKAIELKQFSLVYQPKVSITTGEITGAEALIRWQHPELGTITPFEFITIAEKTKQIIPIGRWVILEACQQAKKWLDLGYKIPVSVNVSTVQFAHDDIELQVRTALAESHLPASYLQLEITETVLMKEPKKLIEICHNLRCEGVTVAIDDFGIAYSSLNYLKQLPIDVLKIDKAFIDDCVDNHHDHMLVRTIVQLGHNMDKKIVAEGVETEEQRLLLVSEQCDEFQGYLYSKPLDVEEFNRQLLQI